MTKVKSAVKKPKENRLKKAFQWLFSAPFKWYDWVLLGALLVVLFLCFQMHDLFHTAGCSFGFLNGHFLDFYDYLEVAGIDEAGGQGLWASYLPTIYFIFAVWNAPLRLFGIVTTPTAQLPFAAIMWAKALPCILYLGCGILIYLIAKELGMGERKSKTVMYAAITVPVALFGQFILGQYESVMLLTVLLGVYFWLKKKPFWFVFWFAIGFTVKYTVALFFIPLLLLREKNFWKILLQFAGFAALFAVEFLLFSGSPAFRAHVFGIGAVNDVTPIASAFSVFYETGFQFVNAKYTVYVVVVLLLLVFAYSYFVPVKSETEEKRYAMFFMCLSFAAMFCFTKFHAHWLIAVIPFWTITAFLTKRPKIYLILDGVFMLFFVMLNVQAFVSFHDESLMNHGILKYFMPGRLTGEGLNMTEFFSFLSPSLVLTVVTALMAVFAVFKHPHFMAEDADLLEGHEMRYVRGRTYLGLAVFLIPCLLCFIATVKPPKAVYDESRISGFESLKEQEITQEFVAEEDRISRMKFHIRTDETNEDTVLHVSIGDASGNVLYQTKVDVSEYRDGERVILKPKLSVEKGGTYTVRFSAENAAEESSVRIYTCTEESAYPAATAGGREAPYHVTMNLYR